MGFFKRSPLPLEEETSRRYLELAPPGPRTEALATCCIVRLLTTPSTAADRYSKLITIAELVAATNIVRDVMVQDRDLSAWVARKSVVMLNALLGGVHIGEDMSKRGLGENTVLALAAVGLEPVGIDRNGEVVLEISAPGELVSEDDQAAALKIARCSLAVLFAALGNPSTRENRFYVDLYTGESGTDVEAKASQITAWTSILTGRLMNADVLQPLFAHDYREIPAMSSAGWYQTPTTQAL